MQRHCDGKRGRTSPRQAPAPPAPRASSQALQNPQKSQPTDYGGVEGCRARVQRLLDSLHHCCNIRDPRDKFFWRAVAGVLFELQNLPLHDVSGVVVLDFRT